MANMPAGSTVSEVLGLLGDPAQLRLLQGLGLLHHNVNHLRRLLYLGGQPLGLGYLPARHRHRLFLAIDAVRRRRRMAGGRACGRHAGWLVA